MTEASPTEPPHQVAVPTALTTLSVVPMAPAATGADFTAAEARAATDQFLRIMETGHERLIELFTRRAWLALGYANWQDYIDTESAGLRSTIRLDRAQRVEIEKAARAKGLSNAVVGSITGVSEKTVRNDLATTEKSGVARSTGMDGRTRCTKRPTQPRRATPVGEPHAERTLADEFHNAIRTLKRATDRIEELMQSDDWEQYGAEIRKRDLPQYQFSRDALSKNLATIHHGKRMEQRGARGFYYPVKR